MEGAFGQGETTKNTSTIRRRDRATAFWRADGKRLARALRPLSRAWCVGSIGAAAATSPLGTVRSPPLILDPHRICVTLRTRLQHHRRHRRAASGGGFMRRIVKCKYFAQPISALLFACRARCVKYPSPSVRITVLSPFPERFAVFHGKNIHFRPDVSRRRAVRSDCEIRTFKTRLDSSAGRL